MSGAHPAGTGKGALLFGGSGFLGPYILERFPDMLSAGRTPPATDNQHIDVPDLGDLSALDDADFDRVIYIIGNTDHYNLEKDVVPAEEPNAFDYHVFPLVQTLEQLKNRGLKKFIFFSSVLVYDPKSITLPVLETGPIDPYRNRYVMSKYLGEELCKFYANWLPIVTVRMSNLYGPTPLERYDLVHVISRQLLKEGKAEIWSRAPMRDFIYVTDAADAIARLLYSDFTGLVNLGTGTMAQVGDVIDVLTEVSGIPIPSKEIPVSGPMAFQCDISRLKSAIDWEPQVGIEEGVRRTFEQMKAWRMGA